jgi:hypothetical protein
VKNFSPFWFYPRRSKGGYAEARIEAIMKSKSLLPAFVGGYLIWLFLGLGCPLLAQNAELSCLITDPSGRAVPGARVVVQSADTGATRQRFLESARRV